MLTLQNACCIEIHSDEEKHQLQKYSFTNLSLIADSGLLLEGMSKDNILKYSELF